MTKKIFKSIMVVAGAVLIASLVIIMGCLYSYFSNVQGKQLEDELSLAAIAVEKDGRNYLEELQSREYRLTWVAENGDVIYDTQSDGESMENHADREEIQEALRNKEGKSSRYSTTLLEKTLYCARRLNDGSVLRISVSSVTIWVLVLGMIQPILIVVVVTLILSGVLASRISKHIMEPLNRLDLEKPLENDTYEELAPLLNRINKQHKQIDMQLSELQRKNDEFAQITYGMTEGLVLLNEKNIILNINPAALKLFHTKRSSIGKDFLTVERSHNVSHAIQDAFSSGHSEIRIEREGKEYQIHVNRIESNGIVIGAVVLAFDITEAAFAERNRREFTANVSHELKTPLQSILGSAELLKNGMVSQEDIPHFSGLIHTEAARLVALDVAVYADAPTQAPDTPPAPPPGVEERPAPPQDTPGEEPPTGPPVSGGEGDPDAAEVARLERMQRPDLEQMAADLGVDSATIFGAKNKHDLAVLIVAAGEPEDGEVPPDLGAGDIVQ